MIKILMLEEKGFSDFSPCNAGWENCRPSHKFGPSIRDHYLIHFVIKGEGSFKTSRGEYRVRAGEAFLIKPGEVSVYEADSANPWEYKWLGFRGGLAKKFSSLPDTFVYDSALIADLTEALEAGAGNEELLTGVIFKLYAYLFCEKQSDDYHNKVVSYINLHYMEDVTISGIAEGLGLNRKYLARIFKEKSGVSMKQFLISKRLHEAKKLLIAGYNVEESAYMVGYNDPFGFSKAFKKKYGVSPASFKRTDNALNRV